MMRRIHELCKENDMPMLSVFCLEYVDIEGDKKEMSIAGCAHFPEGDAVPQPMRLSALIMRLPGYAGLPEATEDDGVH